MERTTTVQAPGPAAIKFNQARLCGFKHRMSPGKWRTCDLARWMRSSRLPPVGVSDSASPLTRQSLKDSAGLPAIPDRDILWAILAWGGMKRDAARRLATNEDVWVQIVGQMRSGKLDRQQSYRVCFDAVHSVRAGGIGPAYFTKLIYFASPSHNGYIMDQWTSRSVNFLVDGPPVVKMRTQNHVSPMNDDRNYERFCQVIEALATECKPQVTPDYVEKCLFSTGGKEPADWRRYLVANGG